MLCEVCCDPIDIIERDGFILDPSGDVTWAGRVIRNLGKTSSAILYELAKANGRRLSADFLAGNCCGDVADPSNNISVHIWRTRKKLKRLGMPDPIGTERNVPGYWWAVN